ncbi:hypothetical protein Rmet_6429 [Cupriavidus metallidurans CH34]|uniref:Uncharacterized protein n=1 Tax=Cupriavidus metallidurans (strain ATCC 43123 / DSM 2839 / NBRC 102507 / CH34) TaxID=266264 RepID=D3DXM6_CUPMC|nr:hypothetical protein Rmet_6429 [Cupriavidus metallidurans CH34]
MLWIIVGNLAKKSNNRKTPGKARRPAPRKDRGQADRLKNQLKTEAEKRGYLATVPANEFFTSDRLARRIREQIRSRIL